MEKKPATTVLLEKHFKLEFDVFVDVGWKEGLPAHSSQYENCVM